MICSFEFAGAFKDGWKVAAVLTPIAFIAWSLCLIAVGVALHLYWSRGSMVNPWPRRAWQRGRASVHPVARRG